MNKEDLIYVAGHRGLLGSAIFRKLKEYNFQNILTIEKTDLDLLDQRSVFEFLLDKKPKYVFLTAARVGGIVANSLYPANFIYQNLQIQNNLIHGSYLAGVEKLLFTGSSCIYPKFSKQPISEDELLSGHLEPTNEAYAIAKIAGLKMCQFYKKQYNCNFISCMPCNLYGVNDNFDEQNSHVIPSLINKIHNAVKRNSEVTLFGTGKPEREFLYVDDAADACLFLMNNYDEKQTINVGSGKDISIKNLAELIASLLQYDREIIWDSSKPDGTPKKLLQTKRINEMGWRPSFTLKEGLLKTIEWFKTLNK